MPPKKIFFLMPSLVGGGAENALIKLLNAFDYDKYEVTLLLVCYHGYYISKIPKNVEVKYLFKNYKFVSILEYLQKKMGWSFLLNWAFKRKINDNYDTAVSFLDSNFTDLLFLLNPTTKKVTWVHSSYLTNRNFNRFYQNKKYLEKIKKNRYKKLDTIVFVSNDAKIEFIEVMGKFDDMRILYNLFDEVDLLQKAQISLPPTQVISFIAVGNLIPVKGYDLLIDAAKILKADGFTFKLEILGKGHQESELKARVQKYDLKNEIQFLGFLDNPYAYINRADVFVMTSVSEGLPSALIEAMIIGKPVLITNTSGCREVIEYGKYGMMSDRTPEAFAEKMKAFIINPDLKNKYAELARQKAKDFSKQNILSSFFDVID
jgi:glycosyltransferase involved in cell wall biosynthesis